MQAFASVGWRQTAVALLIASLHLIAGSQARAQDARVTLHLKAEPLGQALIDFAVQAKVSIGMSDVDLDGAVSKPLDGEYTQAEALRKLLAGTSFDFVFVDSSSVKIRGTAHAASLPAAEPLPIESIVVTATKRDEALQDIPYWASVVSGDALSEFGSGTARGLGPQIAGLTATNLGAGQDKLFVRGLTDSVVPGLSESVLGLYLDEARIVDDAPDPDLRLVDIDRIEVLSGPQGTLYGAGSLTGLVRIISRQPDYDQRQAQVSTDVSATESGGLSNSIDGMLNLPVISDTLAVRAVGYETVDSGYVDNVRLGTSNTNRTTTDGGRILAGWTPRANWSVLANVVLQDTRSSDSQYFVLSLGPYNRDNYLPEPHSDHFLESGITVHGDLGWASITSNTAFVDRTYWTQFDASLAWPSLTGFPAGPSPFDFHRSIRSVSHESRLASQAGRRWTWLFGLSLDHRDEDFLSTLTGPDPGLAEILARMERREDRLNEAAVFAESSFAFSDVLSLTAGIRGYDASHIVSATSEGLLVGAPTAFSGTSRQPGAIPKLLIKYAPQPNETFYAQYTQGYRLGGLNVDGPAGVTGENSTTFDSDNLQNYEIGAKIKFFDGDAFANAAAYYEDWKNIQTDEIAPDGAFYVVNAGKVRDPGFEIEFGGAPIDGLQLNANLFWHNPALAESIALGNKGDAALPGAPSVTTGFSIRYARTVASDITIFAGLSDSYVGSSHIGFVETTPSMGNYNIANIRLGASRGQWQATVFVTNLTDDRRNTFAFGDPFNPQSQITPPRPRTAGVSLEWSD